MKLLFDQNLSPRLIDYLTDLYPDSSHVSACGLGQANDDAVWDYAQAHGYIIVSKDADFNEISLLRGFPPNVIWIRRGNCTTGEIEDLLRQHYDLVKDMVQDQHIGMVLLF